MCFSFTSMTWGSRVIEAQIGRSALWPARWIMALRAFSSILQLWGSEVAGQGRGRARSSVVRRVVGYTGGVAGCPTLHGKAGGVCLPPPTSHLHQHLLLLLSIYASFFSRCHSLFAILHILLLHQLIYSSLENIPKATRNLKTPTPSCVNVWVLTTSPHNRVPWLVFQCEWFANSLKTTGVLALKTSN